MKVFVLNFVRDVRVVCGNFRFGIAALFSVWSVVLFYLLTTPLLIGCSSLVEKAGRAFDGSAFAEEELALYRLAWAEGYTDAEGEEPDREESGSVEVRLLRRTADGAEFLAIFPGVLPTLRINATVPDAGGRFYLTSADFLCSTLQGWNEFTLDISGSGT
ncbi:MAG: hypothetical protein LBQ57_05160, partial [Spirochaetales bacterium]|nr:hypothetical protein [Spirochaetales bacterium]